MNVTEILESVIDDELESLAGMLGLSEWSIVWEIGDRHSYAVTGENYATISYNLCARKATVSFSPFTDIDQWKATLRHELLHLVLAPLVDVARRDIPEEEKDALVDGVEHGIINRLVKLL